MISENNTRFLVTLDKSLYENLKYKANKENKSVSNYVAGLIKSDVGEDRPFEVVGRLWNNTDLPIISDSNRYFVLCHWNGETYNKCWQVKDSKGLEQILDKSYTITPIYKEVAEDDFEIVDYKIEED